jgi:nucleoside phosphorylase
MKAIIFTAKDTETVAVDQQLIQRSHKRRETRHFAYETYRLRAQLTGQGVVKDLEVAHYETGRGQDRVLLAVREIVTDFDPDIVLFVGCAGGEVSELNVNDVLIVTHAWPYEIGKEGARKFKSRAHPLEPDGYLVDVANSIGKRTAWRSRISKEYNVPSSVKPGQVASGNKVLVSEKGINWRLAKSINDEIVAVETEAAGFYRAMQPLRRPYLMIRGISDNLANKNTSGKKKDDDRQTRATAQAAALAAQLLVEANYKSLRESRGATISAVTASTLEGFWQSNWKYGTEKCRELLHIEQIDGSGRVFGRRVSMMSGYEYNYDVSGIFYSNRLFLSAIPSNHSVLISVCLALMPENHFLNSLTGIAIRPMGEGQFPKFREQVLRYKKDLWASLVKFTRVRNPKKEVTELWAVYRRHWPES